MTVATVVLCPPLPGDVPLYDVADTADGLLDDPACRGIRVLSPSVADPPAEDDARTRRAHWVAHLAIALATGGSLAPVLLVVDGTAGELAPALGFSQKAARRAVSGYVLIDALVPRQDDRIADWPDAPVAYLASASADVACIQQARLRGWEVVDIADTAAGTVAAAIAAIASR
jgi:hypothetical protein